MKRLLKTRDVWAFVVLPLIVALVPYALAWFWPSPKDARAAIYDPRVFLTAWVFISGLLCRIKILIKERTCLLDNPIAESVTDILFLNLPMLGGAVIVLFCSLPALFLSKVLWGIKQNKYTKRVELQKAIGTYSFVLLVAVFVHDRPFVQFLASILFFMRTFEIGTYMMVRYVAAVREDSLFVEKMIQGIYYLLCNAMLYVIGAPITYYGSLPDYFDSIYANHEGFLEYFVWVVMMRFLPTKFIAGKNLLKYPIFGDFIEIVCILTDRKQGNARKFFPWLANQLCKLTLFLVGRIFGQKNRGRLWNAAWFQWVWKKTMPVVGKNIGQMRTIKSAKEDGIIVVVPPDGRERLSDNGKLKPHGTSAAQFLDCAVPVLVIGAMHFKPASNKEPLAKKNPFFQRWLSPCRIEIHFLDPIRKLPGESNESFTLRLDQALIQKKIELGLLVS